MSQQTSGLPPAAPAGGAHTTGTTPTTDPATTQVARDEASQVGRTTADAGRQVVGTAKEQAGQVTQEARRQAKDLLQQARGQAAEQARTGQQKATDGLRALAGELHQMADGGDRSGPASDLAKQAAGRVDDVAAWLDQREPGDLLQEFRGLARRRPGAFLLGAAIAGVVAGRLTRGTIDANRDTDDRSRQPGGYPVGDPTGYDGGRYDYTPAYREPTTDPFGAQGIPPATAPRPYAPGSVAPGSGVGPGPDPYMPGSPAVGQPPTGPAHAMRPGASTVGEYVQDIERGETPPEGRPYQGGSR